MAYTILYLYSSLLNKELILTRHACFCMGVQIIILLFDNNFTMPITITMDWVYMLLAGDFGRIKKQ